MFSGNSCLLGSPVMKHRLSAKRIVEGMMILDTGGIIEFTTRKRKGDGNRLSAERLERISQDSIEDLLIDSLADGFFCDGIPVHISFVNEERELSKVLIEYFCSLK